jgi:hypothetical protein
LTQTELIMRLRPDQYPNDFYKIGLTCWWGKRLDKPVPRRPWKLYHGKLRWI